MMTIVACLCLMIKGGLNVGGLMDWKDLTCDGCKFMVMDEAGFEGECREGPPPYPCVAKGTWEQTACSKREEE